MSVRKTSSGNENDCEGVVNTRHVIKWLGWYSWTGSPERNDLIVTDHIRMVTSEISSRELLPQGHGHARVAKEHEISRDG